MTAHALRRLRRRGGYSLLELTVATTLLSTFALVMSAVSTTYFGLLGDLDVWTENLRDANVIRARIIGDAKRAFSSTCSDTEHVMFTLGEEAGVQVEYSARSGNLIRWQSLHDRELALGERVSGLVCTDLGSAGLELQIAIGDEEHPFQLYVHVAQAEEEDEGEEGEG